jgi:hypothetical protein
VEALKEQDAGGGVATLERPAPEPQAQQGRAELVVRQAAQFTAGALGMAVMAVLIHVVRTLKDLVLRR